MAARVDVSPAVLTWALEVTGADPEGLESRFNIAGWLGREVAPTLKQLQSFATAAGVPFGYLLLSHPPEWALPIADFREGFADARPPSADLLAVIRMSQRRQEWYREHAMTLGAEELPFVGSAADMAPEDAAARIRAALGFEVSERSGTWRDARKYLLRSFEEIGGLTVATSMVGNNTHRPLNENEFRGFTLVDPIAPLVFVNTRQSLNGQIFTLAHELAHVWRGTSRIGNEEPRSEGQSEVERWCNAVASEVLVPRDELRSHYAAVSGASLTQALDELARTFRCGTLVVLQALHRTGIRRINDFATAYDDEVDRLRRFTEKSDDGGNFYYIQPYRIGERLSRALIADALEGRTPMTEALRLMSLKSVSVFDSYARRLGAA